MHHYRAFTQFAALLSPIEAERKRNAWTMASIVDSCNCKKRMEARVGIEPTYKGFADLSLTTWVPRQLRSYCVLLSGHLHNRRTYSTVLTWTYRLWLSATAFRASRRGSALKLRLPSASDTTKTANRI